VFEPVNDFDLFAGQTGMPERPLARFPQPYHEGSGNNRKQHNRDCRLKPNPPMPVFHGLLPCLLFTNTGRWIAIDGG